MGKQLQLNLDLGRHGGRRKGSGRPRRRSKGVSHEPREELSSRTPVHINFKYTVRVRHQTGLRILKTAILNSKAKGLNIVLFSLQSNHVHLIAEAANKNVLERGMRSLTVTMAKGLGKGCVQPERYHLHVLRNPKEAMNAVRYVRFNHERHTGKRCVDPFTSFQPGSAKSYILKTAILNS